MRLAVIGSADVTDLVSRDIALCFGVREVTGADLPWPERFQASGRRITVRHPAVQRLVARMIFAGERAGYVLCGLPSQRGSIQAVLDRAQRLRVEPELVIAVGPPPQAFAVFESAGCVSLTVPPERRAVQEALSGWLGSDGRLSAATLPAERATAPGLRSVRR